MKRPAWLLALAWLAACGDPTHERQVAELGDETPGVPVGPLHRPGQPCGVCHGERGPGEPSFSLSGTLYRTADSSRPLSGVRVHLLDATGAQRTVTSNCAGNFYLDSDAYQPTYPLWVKLEWGETVVEMRSAISRESSCAGCHRQPASPSSVGQVYLWADEAQAVEGEPCE